MTYNCNECKTNLIYMNNGFWLCNLCNKIIEIPLTKNWKQKDKNDNRLFLFEKSNIIKHELIIKPDTMRNFDDFMGWK